MSLQQNRRVSFSDMNRSLTVTNGNTGIGTTAPSHMLDVNGGVRSTNFTTTNALITTAQITNLNAIGNSNTLGNVFTTGGNVGISTTSPSSKFHVHASDFPNIKLTTDNIYVNAIELDSTNKTGGVNWRVMSSHQSASEGQGKFVIQQVSGGLYPFSITSTGNVGISTINPANNLDVTGTARITTSLTTGAVYATNSTVTNAVATTVSASTAVATTISAGTAVATTFTGGSIGLTGAANAVTGTIGTFVTTTVSASTAVATTYTGGSMSLSGNLAIGGTLTTVNITTTNISETNVSAGTVSATNIGVTTQTVGTSRITTSLLAIGNSNTIGSIYTTGGNVGIGTTVPGYTLEVNGTARVANGLYVGSANSMGTIYMGGGSAGDSGFDMSVIETRQYALSENSEMVLFKGNDPSGASGPDRIRLRAGGIAFDTYSAATTDRTAESIRMYITDTGNVGIGTTSPSLAFHVKTSNVGDTMILENSSALGYATMQMKTPSQTFYIGLGGASEAQNLYRDKLYILNQSSNGIVLDTNGYVGIGTKSPIRSLHVTNNMRIGGSGAVIDLGDDLTTQIYRNGTTSEMRFNTNSTERFTITSTGNVGIGTVSPANSLHVYGSTNGEIGTRLENANSGSSAYTVIRVTNDVGLCAMFLNSSTRISDGGTNTMTIRNDIGPLRLQGSGANNTLWLSTGGNIGFGTTSPSALLQLNTGGTVLMQLNTAGRLSVLDDVIAFASFSDSRLKTDIQTVSETDAVDVVNALRPVTFKWRDTISNVGKRGVLDIGFIAQEVEAVAPYTVEEFQDMADSTAYKRIKHERLIPYLVGSIQDLTRKLQITNDELQTTKDEFQILKTFIGSKFPHEI